MIIKFTLRIALKYGPHNEKVISGLRRVSKPGLRKYVKADDIPKVMSGLGISIERRGGCESGARFFVKPGKSGNYRQ
jgi:hypothetical protein